MKGTLTKFTGTMLVLAVLSGPATGSAEVKEIVSEGAYSMGRGESPAVAETRALHDAKKRALAQARRDVEDYARARDLRLTAEEAAVLATAVMRPDVLEKERTNTASGADFRVRIKVRVASGNLEGLVKRVREKSVIEDFRKIQAAYDTSQKEIESLQQRLASVPDGEGRAAMEESIAAAERLFQAAAWFDEGCNRGLEQEYGKAIAAFTAAVALRADFAEAYTNRGYAYYH